MSTAHGVILADPPWDFKTRSHKGEGRSAKAYYDTMSIEEIAALPVAALAAKDNKKPNKNGDMFSRLGQGYGTRKQAELCLLGTRGNPKCRSRRIREVTISPRRDAHQKPDLYPDIEQLFAGPYVELFARQRWPEWDVAFSREADTVPHPAAGGQTASGPSA